MVVKAVLGLFALVALGMGAVFGWIGVSSLREAARLPSLPRLGVADFAADAVGRAGLVEGELSAENAMPYQDLVLFFRSRLRGYSKQDDQGVLATAERRPVWEPVEKKLPPLRIDAAGETILVYGDYGVTFQGSDPSLLTTTEMVVGETERYEGLRVGQRVTAVGTVGFAAEVPGLDTETLVSGSLADAIGGARSSARFGLIAGSALLLVGVVLAILAVTV